MAKRLMEMTNEELWELFPIVLTKYDSRWPGFYEEEQGKIVDAVGESAVARIQHIGSTAVPGLIAKPTIDMLLELQPSTDLSYMRTAVEELGYIFSPQPHKPEPHMMFQKGYTEQGFADRVYHLHIRYPGDWPEPYFRDYLRAHPETAREYGQLKRQLQRRFEHDRDGYTQAKTAFVQKYTALAQGRYVHD